LTPSDETTVITSMDFLTFEDNYLAGAEPGKENNHEMFSDSIQTVRLQSTGM